MLRSSDPHLCSPESAILDVGGRLYSGLPCSIQDHVGEEEDEYEDHGAGVMHQRSL